MFSPDGRMDLQVFEKTVPPVYTRMILCFPLQDSQSSESVFNCLSQSLETVVNQLPFLGGTVIGAGDGSEGKKKEHRHIRKGAFSGLQSKDLVSSYDYAALREGHFPMRVLDDRFLPTALAQPFPTPVFAAQVTFVEGGFFLGLCFHHSALDTQGAMTVVELWSAHCRVVSGDVFSQDELQLPPESFARPLMRIPRVLVDSSSEAEKWIILPELHQGSPPALLKDFEAEVYYFSPVALSSLKATATSSVTAPYITTNDVLMALFWSTIMGARHGTSSVSAEEPFTVGFNVDLRCRLTPPLPVTYLGSPIMLNHVEIPVEDLKIEPPEARLSHAAALVRKAINSVTTGSIEGKIAYLETLDGDEINRTIVPWRGDLGINKTILTTTWRNKRVYQFDWGQIVGGKCETFRFPRKSIFNGVQAVLPQLPDGGIEVVITAERGELRRIREDTTWRRWADFVCD